jgi:hypothetical protein
MTEYIYKDLYGLHFFKKLFQSQAEAARYYKVSDAFMSKVVKGESPPTKAMLEDCGYERIVIKEVKYRRIKGGETDGE